MTKNTKTRGFTLIEILVVIGIIAILAAVVIIAINPARQFAQARNSQRMSNLETILNGVGQNLADNKGVFTCSGQTIGAPSASSSVGTTASTPGTPFADLSTCLSAYIPGGIPMDPNGGTPADTLYDISYNSSNGRYMVCAPNGNETVLGSSNPGALCVTR